MNGEDRIDQLIRQALQEELDSWAPEPGSRERVWERLVQTLALEERRPRHVVPGWPKIALATLAVVIGLGVLTFAMSPSAVTAIARKLYVVIYERKQEAESLRILGQGNRELQPPGERPGTRGLSLAEAQEQVPFRILQLNPDTPDYALREITIDPLTKGLVRVVLRYEIQKHTVVVTQRNLPETYAGTDNFDLDRFRVEAVTIRGMQGYLVTPKAEIRDRAIIWVEGQVRYQINSDMPAADLVQLAQSMR